MNKCKKKNKYNKQDNYIKVNKVNLLNVFWHMDQLI